jgi:hypothetical protein
MRSTAQGAALALMLLLPVGACSGGGFGTSGGGMKAGSVADAAQDDGEPGDAAAPPMDAAEGGNAADAPADTGAACFVSSVGVYGQCMTLAACAAVGDHISTPGYCSGPADVECCTRTPSVADNPPVPAGWKLMPQSAVTPAMTAWAVAILHDPTTYPMFSTAMMTFGSLMVMARVEWHPPDFQNNTVHRGVTLYEPG